MKIAVCEDNNIVSSYMEDYISSLDLQDIEYEIFSSGDDLIHYMEVENAIFNIYFMDIEMPGRNGIETSAYIRSVDKNALIIFITDHKEYVYDVFDVLPFRFLIKPVTQTIDLIDYNGEKCINVMSFGLDTKVETIGRIIAGKVKFLGSQAYNIAVVPAVLQSMKYQINFDLDCIGKDGKPYKWTVTPADYTLLAICNASYYGGGFCPAPNSKLDDGILDFCMADAVNLFQALPLIPKYSAGTANDETSPYMHTGYLTGGRIWSVDGSGLLGNCDGENFDYPEVNFKVEKHALNLCFIKE